MGLFDKVIDMMHLGGDYEGYDDDYDDDYEDDRPRKSVFKKKDKDYDYDLEADVVSDSGKVKSVKQTSRITPMRKKISSNNQEVCVFKPTQFEDTKEIAETLLADRTVVLNFEGLDVEISQRIIDFTSGACFAIGGNLQKVSNYIFLVTPRTVEISGDVQEILSGAFDIPNI